MGGRGYSSATKRRKAAKPDTSYQGSNSGSGAAQSKGDILYLKDKLPELQSEKPKPYLEDKTSDETRSQLAGITSLDDFVTIYRATPGETINSNDWVFMSREQANNFATSPFSGKPRPGYNVVESRVKASEIGWAGKNLEFVYLGSKPTGKAAPATPRKR